MDNPALIEHLSGRFKPLRVPEVAELLNISKRNVYQILQDGKLPHFVVGGVKLVDPKQLKEYLLERNTATRKPLRYVGTPAKRKVS